MPILGIDISNWIFMSIFLIKKQRQKRAFPIQRSALSNSIRG